MKMKYVFLFLLISLFVVGIGYSTSCSYWTDCPTGYLYCWGDQLGSYQCHTECASAGKYTQSSSDCCYGLSWDASTKMCHSDTTCSGNVAVSASKVGNNLNVHISGLSNCDGKTVWIKMVEDLNVDCSKSLGGYNSPYTSCNPVGGSCDGTMDIKGYHGKYKICAKINKNGDEDYADEGETASTVVDLGNGGSYGKLYFSDVYQSGEKLHMTIGLNDVTETPKKTTVYVLLTKEQNFDCSNSYYYSNGKKTSCNLDSNQQYQCQVTMDVDDLESGDYKLCAKVNLNNDGDYSDSGEIASKTVSISGINPNSCASIGGTCKPLCGSNEEQNGNGICNSGNLCCVPKFCTDSSSCVGDSHGNCWVCHNNHCAKSHEKQGYKDGCSKDCQCKQGTGLKCISGLCQCPQGESWDGNECKSTHCNKGSDCKLYNPSTPYCWGDYSGNYHCHSGCAEEGKYVPSEDQCCTGLILKGGKCVKSNNDNVKCTKLDEHRNPITHPDWVSRYVKNEVILYKDSNGNGKYDLGEETKTYYDKCMNDKKLIEYVCNGDDVKSYIIDCTYNNKDAYCTDGVCINNPHETIIKFVASDSDGNYIGGVHIDIYYHNDRGYGKPKVDSCTTSYNPQDKGVCVITTSEGTFDFVAQKDGYETSTGTFDTNYKNIEEIVTMIKSGNGQNEKEEGCSGNVAVSAKQNGDKMDVHVSGLSNCDGKTVWIKMVEDLNVDCSNQLSKLSGPYTSCNPVGGSCDGTMDIKGYHGKYKICAKINKNGDEDYADEGETASTVVDIGENAVDVKVKSGGSPVYHAHVTLYYLNNRGFGKGEYKDCYTNVDGECLFDEMVVGDYEIDVSKDGYEDAKESIMYNGGYYEESIEMNEIRRGEGCSGNVAVSAKQNGDKMDVHVSGLSNCDGKTVWIKMVEDLNVDCSNQLSKLSGPYTSCNPVGGSCDGTMDIKGYHGKYKICAKINKNGDEDYADEGETASTVVDIGENAGALLCEKIDMYGNEIDPTSVSKYSIDEAVLFKDLNGDGKYNDGDKIIETKKDSCSEDGKLNEVICDENKISTAEADCGDKYKCSGGMCIEKWSPNQPGSNKPNSLPKCGKSCESQLDCSDYDCPGYVNGYSSTPTCWGDEKGNYHCHCGCAGVGKYAPSSDQCCAGLKYDPKTKICGENAMEDCKKCLSTKVLGIIPHKWCNPGKYTYSGSECYLVTNVFTSCSGYWIKDVSMCNATYKSCKDNGALW